MVGEGVCQYDGKVGYFLLFFIGKNWNSCSTISPGLEPALGVFLVYLIV